MNKFEVFAKLCVKDRRNPRWLDLYADDENPPEPRISCFCDNCFHGRDKLAVEILRLQECIKHNKT